MVKDREMMNALSNYVGLNIREYLIAAIESFDYDPPSSDYQEGYLSALKDIRREIFHLEKGTR